MNGVQEQKNLPVKKKVDKKKAIQKQAAEVHMAEKVPVKALVDKESNKIIFIESGSDFIDVLFSFLTIPLGRIVGLGCNHSTPVEIGCMKNLYQSIQKIDVHDFRSNAYKDMLLLPESAAESHCKNLKLKIVDPGPTRYFRCSNCNECCFAEKFKKYCAAKIRCPSCFFFISEEYWFPKDSEDGSQAGAIFVKGRPRLIITDDLQVIPPVSAASISLFTKLGVSDKQPTEEMTFSIGVEEVLNLLMNSLVSRTPFTETLLKHKPSKTLGDMNSNEAMPIESRMLCDTDNKEERNIVVKLIVSKTKKVVCYAEAQEDFVNLLFSFMTLPLGFILENIRNGSWEGCIDQLSKTVRDLDEKYLKSNYHKGLLVNQKLVPGVCYKSHLLGIEEAPLYYTANRMVSTDESRISTNSVKLKTFDPISSNDEDGSAQGFLKGPALFTVTDNLVVSPVSPILQMSVLQELKVPFTDIEDHIVHVGKKEALRLLVASFIGGNALTNAFLKNLKEPKQEQ